jgi:hypothetical protein
MLMSRWVDVGSPLARERQRLEPVAGLADDRHVRLGAEEQTEARARSSAI